MIHISIMIAAPVDLNLSLQKYTRAHTIQYNQQMEHIQCWKWPLLNFKSHWFTVLNYNSCSNLGPPTTDARRKPQVVPLSDYILKETLPSMPFLIWMSWTHVNLISNTSLIHIKHYEEFVTLLTGGLTTKLHLKMNTASRSFQFTTWACCPIITPCSALLVFHFSTFIHTPQNAISFYPSPDEQTPICHRSHYAPLSRT